MYPTQSSQEQESDIKNKEECKQYLFRGGFIKVFNKETHPYHPGFLVIELDDLVHDVEQ